ncbi:MAG: GntR family transcriptional regulator [Alistipes sp.]|nr:GntR family transcriptional regulator [Alistipes sp.]
MNFDNTQPIWMQIYELILSRIAAAEWAEEERIPSVRELGATLVVNPNTVMRTYERLTEQGLIYNKRGIGYFVAEGAKAAAAAIARERFITEQLPPLFARMKSIGITAEEFLTIYNQYNNENE